MADAITGIIITALICGTIITIVRIFANVVKEED